LLGTKANPGVLFFKPETISKCKPQEQMFQNEKLLQCISSNYYERVFSKVELTRPDGQIKLFEFLIMYFLVYHVG